jgi:hypothetical protein
MVVFIFKPREQLIKASLILYVVTLLGILGMMPQYQKDYDHIVMVPHPEPPNLYLLFWGNIPPTDAQRFGENYNETKNDASFLDRFKIADLPTNDLDLARALQPKTLYLVTQKELRADLRGEKKPPPGIDLIDVITYPDKEVAFYLIKKSDRINQ